MTGASLSKADVIALRDNRPSEILDILGEEELNALNMLMPRSLHIEDKKEIVMPLDEILSSIRKNIFENIDLPSTFPNMLKNAGGFKENSSDIGIVIADNANLEKAKERMIDTLSIRNDITKQRVEQVLSFQPRMRFDGPIAVKFIPASKIEKVRDSLA